MICPRCKERFKPEDNEGRLGHVKTGEAKLDYIVACFTCSWQVSIRELEAWLKRFGYRK